MKDLLNKLNNLNYSDEHLKIVRQYLEKKEIPKEYSYQQKYLFIKHYKGFELEKDKIIYKPLNLEAISESRKDDVLQKLYNDPVTGLASGLRTFYDRVTFRYIGITQKDVKTFLEKQEVYQLVKAPQQKINKTLISKYCNALWSMDLIDVNYYHGHNRKRKYILTVIDHFSKYVFAEGLIKKDAKSVVKALENIHKRSKVYPVKLLSDNGKEFVNEDMEALAKENNIFLVQTETYSPTQNALIENFNGVLRKMMRESFVRNNNFNWIDNLQTFCDSRNGTKHSVTKRQPDEVYTSTRGKIDKVRVKDGKIDLDVNEKQSEVSMKLLEYGKQNIEKKNRQKIVKGDHVRIYLPLLDTKLRKLIKKGESKKIIVKFSKEIYVVAKVINPNNSPFENQKYVLVDDKGDFLYNEDGKVMKAFANELQKVPDDLVKIRVDAENLNEIQEDENEVIEVVPEKKEAPVMAITARPKREARKRKFFEDE